MEFLGLSAAQWQEVGIALAILVGAAVLGKVVLWIIDKGLMRFSQRTRTSFDDAILGVKISFQVSYLKKISCIFFVHRLPLNR